MVKTLFLDTEFTELTQKAQLISLALVDAEREYSFYAEFTDFDRAGLSEWHFEHVIDNLLYESESFVNKRNGAHWVVKGKRNLIVEQLNSFFDQFQSIEIWGDVLAYDWVLFCQLFGGAFVIPSQLFYSSNDISNLLKFKGFNPDTARESLVDPAELKRLNSSGLKKHNALYDAHLMAIIYKTLNA